MPLSVTCPHCRRPGTIPAAAAGRAVKCPNCKQSFQAGIQRPIQVQPTTRRRGVGFFLAVAFAIFGAGAGIAAIVLVVLHFSNATGKAEQQVITVDSLALVMRFNENAVAAELDFGGKILDVSGQVVAIETGNSHDCVLLLGMERPGQDVQCVFAQTHRPQLASLRLREHATIRGRCQRQGARILLMECEVVPARQKSAG